MRLTKKDRKHPELTGSILTWLTPMSNGKRRGWWAAKYHTLFDCGHPRHPCVITTGKGWTPERNPRSNVRSLTVKRHGTG